MTHPLTFFLGWLFSTPVPFFFDNVFLIFSFLNNFTFPNRWFFLMPGNTSAIRVHVLAPKPTALPSETPAPCPLPSSFNVWRPSIVFTCYMKFLNLFRFALKSHSILYQYRNAPPITDALVHRSPPHTYWPHRPQQFVELNFISVLHYLLIHHHFFFS